MDGEVREHSWVGGSTTINTCNQKDELTIHLLCSRVARRQTQSIHIFNYIYRSVFFLLLFNFQSSCNLLFFSGDIFIVWKIKRKKNNNSRDAYDDDDDDDGDDVFDEISPPLQQQNSDQSMITMAYFILIDSFNLRVYRRKKNCMESNIRPLSQCQNIQFVCSINLISHLCLSLLFLVGQLFFVFSLYLPSSALRLSFPSVNTKGWQKKNRQKRKKKNSSRETSKAMEI